MVWDIDISQTGNPVYFIATNTNFIVFGLTRPGLEPTIYRNRGEQANHYTTEAVQRSLFPTLYSYSQKVYRRQSGKMGLNWKSEGEFKIISKRAV
jgi:hypothetical protein